MSSNENNGSVSKNDQEQIIANIRAKRYEPSDLRPSEYIDETFLSFIRAGRWERAGSSSIGRVEISFVTDGKLARKRFKSRKNFLLDLYTAESLYNRCLAMTEQANTALIKSELGKIRIAVASPVEHYLMYSWLLSKTGSFYTARWGNTLEETPVQEGARMWRISRMLRRGLYALPFDYAKFDHQPTSDEIRAIDDNLYHLADQAVTEGLRPEVSTVVSILQRAHDRATIAAPSAWPGGGSLSG